jgi:hypothetical protein
MKTMDGIASSQEVPQAFVLTGKAVGVYRTGGLEGEF